MKNFSASTVEYIKGSGLCFICTSEPFEEIDAGTELNIILPFGKNHVVKTCGSSIRAFGSAWGVPVRTNEVWTMLNN